MGQMDAASEGITASSDRVASIVEHRSEPAFVLLLQLADRHFADPEFSDALVRSLRNNPALIEHWQTWSQDQRWTPSVYMHGTEVGWFDGASSNVRTHPDRAAAAPTSSGEGQPG